MLDHPQRLSQIPDQMVKACERFIEEHEGDIEQALMGSTGGADEISKPLCKKVRRPRACNTTRSTGRAPNNPCKPSRRPLSLTRRQSSTNPFHPLQGPNQQAKRTVTGSASVHACSDNPSPSRALVPGLQRREKGGGGPERLHGWEADGCWRWHFPPPCPSTFQPRTLNHRQ